MKIRTNIKLLTLSGIIILFGLLLISNSFALNTKISNESIQAKESLNQTEKDIIEMIGRNIPVKRVNESYQEALQIYSAQLALEEKESKADYKLVMEYASEVSSIKKTAIEANDELNVFKETFTNAEKETNLSEMQDEYNQIILSFNKERFEDTLILIKQGYNRISEIQSSQTVINAVYKATSRTIKYFFIKNGVKIIIIGCIALFLLFVFWNTLTKLRMRIKLNNLNTQKRAINGLIKEMQGSYFKSKKISENEYKIKLKNYEEFIRDIERQIMVLNEEIFKINKKSSR